MEALKELGTGIPLRMVFLGHVWIFGPSIIRHIIRDTGTGIEVSTSIFILWISESHLDVKSSARRICAGNLCCRTIDWKTWFGTDIGSIRYVRESPPQRI